MVKKMLPLVLFYVPLLLLCFSCALWQKSSPGMMTPETKNFDYYFELGTTYMKLRDYDKAIANFTAALDINPHSFRAQNLCGIAYFYLKNYPLAEEKFLEAIRLNSSFAEAYNNLGALYFATRRLAEAKRTLEKALILSPDSVAAHYTLGSLLLLLGETENGIQHLLRAVELDPDYLDKNPPMLVDIASVEVKMGEIYFTYAKIYAQKGIVEKVVEYLTKAQQAGFDDWARIKQEKEFEAVREDPRVAIFIR